MQGSYPKSLGRKRRAVFLTRLNLKNVKSFLGPHSLDLTDSRGGPARWTLIVGDNGVGKTTLLECLAHLTPVLNSDDKKGSRDPKMFIEPKIAAASNDVIDDLGRNGDIDFEIEALFAVNTVLEPVKPTNVVISTRLTYSRRRGKSNDIKASDFGREKNFTQSKWTKSFKFSEPLILAYGAGRHMGIGNLDIASAPGGTDSLLEGKVELFDAEELLQQFDYATKSKDKTARSQKRLLLSMIASLLPEVEDEKSIQIYPPAPIGSRGRSGVYIRTSDGEVRLSQLSFGYKTMMAWLSDIAWRLFEHYPKSRNPLHEPAIVLVDEIDLHLHPKWQRQLRSRLTTHFPNVQFVATAHSPLMAQAFLDANLAVVMRDGDHSIVENDPAVLANWRVNQIVTSDLVGLKSSWPPNIDALFVEEHVLKVKRNKTAKDRARLKKLKEQILELPTDSPENEEAMSIIRKAAARLKLSSNSK